jgi:ABC-type multidrug transport system fused ATPase/permease subunit
MGILRWDAAIVVHPLTRRSLTYVSHYPTHLLRLLISGGACDNALVTVRHAIRRSLALLSRRDRKLFAISIVIQMSTSFLDLVGVLLIGLVGALSVTTIQSQPAPASVRTLADFFGLDGLSDQELVVALASAAACVLLVKSIASSILTRRVLIFLANRQAMVSARLSSAFLSRPLSFIHSRSSQEAAFALIYGAGAATMSILGLLTIVASELALLIILSTALLLISPIVALSSIAFFTIVALALQRAMGSWALRVGSEAAQADIASMNAVQEAIATYREITVTDRRGLFVDRIHQLRWRAAKVAADAQFIGMFPKYMFEAALVVGGFVLASVLFATQEAVAAVGTLALFLAAATRVMPSLLRLQGATLGLRGAAGGAMPTFRLADDLGSALIVDEPASSGGSLDPTTGLGAYPEFFPSIAIEGVGVTYPGATKPALAGITMTLEPGRSLALVGTSGAGKSTLADVILGVLEPDRGQIRLGSCSPTDAIRRWPGALGYVPQDVALVNGTIRSNVALGLPFDMISDELVWDALDRAHLSNYLRDSRDGLDTEVGENGVRLSGGQRQRLGIARALYSRPRLLVLDEATSALDAETEAAITETLTSLEGIVTTVVIAHRLSTVRNADLVAYLENGHIRALGSFELVRELVPALDRQANLMGLN